MKLHQVGWIGVALTPVVIVLSAVIILTKAFDLMGWYILLLGVTAGLLMIGIATTKIELDKLEEEQHE